jgi:hypothetical protein
VVSGGRQKISQKCKAVANPPIQRKKAMSGKKIEEIKFPMLK